MMNAITSVPLAFNLRPVITSTDVVPRLPSNPLIISGSNRRLSRAIDQTILGKLRTRMGAVIDEVIDIYLDDTPKLLAQMQHALNQGGVQLLHRAAHTLKPTSRTLGATRFAHLCEEVEAMSEGKALQDGIAEKVEQLAVEYARVEAELKLATNK